jgi:hypothetical protein
MSTDSNENVIQHKIIFKTRLNKLRTTNDEII